MPRNSVSAADTGLPVNTADQMPALPDGALDRLARFAEWTGAAPPARLIEGEGADRTFSTELLAYAEAQGLSLDWFWLNDVRGLVMAFRQQTRRPA